MEEHLYVKNRTQKSERFTNTLEICLLALSKTSFFQLGREDYRGM